MRTKDDTGIPILKGPVGYYVDYREFEDPEGWPKRADTYLKVECPLDGATITFDHREPMIVEDFDGRTLLVTFDDEKIRSIVDQANPGVELTELKIDQENMFWFLTVGIPPTQPTYNAN